MLDVLIYDMLLLELLRSLVRGHSIIKKSLGTKLIKKEVMNIYVFRN